MTVKTDMPISGRALDILKILAAIFMLLDHIDAQLMTRSTGILYLIGRGAYPLFAYAAAASVVRAGVERAPVYARRLLLIAILIIPITQLARDQDAGNILFTLTIGLGIIPWVASMGARGRHIFFVVCLAGIVFPNLFEFGWVGAALPAAFYLVLKNEAGKGWIWPLLIGLNFGGFYELLANFSWADAAILSVIALATLVMTKLSIYISQQFPNDQTRLMPKYFLHIFYPAHILALALVGHYLI